MLPDTNQPDTKPAKTKKLRLFFALWPDEAVRDSLARLKHGVAKKCTGKPIQTSNLHITLAFLGNVDADRLECILPMAEAISFKPFGFKLDHLGLFRNSKVIWGGLDTEPAELINLAAELHQGAIACGIKMDNRPYTPHLTLLRKATHLPSLTIKPVNWKANDFCLVLSETTPDGVKYSVLNRWS